MAVDEPAIDADVARLARRIRAWREEAGLSLAELSVRSGVSRSTIHKIETLQMVPTIAVLLRVARGLERSPAELVRDDEPDRALAVLAAGTRQVLGSPSGVMVERLSGDLADPQLEAWRVVLGPGQDSGTQPLDYDGEELVVVEDGELDVEVAGAHHRLRAGDVLHLKAGLPHRWRNPARRPARFVVVGTVPAALRAAMQRRATGQHAPGTQPTAPATTPTAFGTKNAGESGAFLVPKRGGGAPKRGGGAPKRGGGRRRA